MLAFEQTTSFRRLERATNKDLHIYRSRRTTSETRSYNEEEKWIIWGGCKLGGLLIEFIEKADKAEQNFSDYETHTKKKEKNAQTVPEKWVLGYNDIETNRLRVGFQA